MSDFSACYLINCMQFHTMYTVIAVEMYIIIKTHVLDTSSNY